MDKTVIKGVIIDPIKRTRTGSEITIKNGIITEISENKSITHPFIIPGFIDAHVHIESSMLIPSEFAKLAIQNGTIAVVCDPHEIANVAGQNGIDFMIEDARKTNLKCFFGAPSCVPASPVEKCAEEITAPMVEQMLNRKEFTHLAEMMNFPGVLENDKQVMAKIKAATFRKKPIDGHAPGLTGENLSKYVNAGVSTDHECTTIEEAEEKIRHGMKIIIREGSAAKNFDNLIPLIQSYPDSIMFCTDDCHPDYLLGGHINKLVSRAVKSGYDLFDSIRCACVNAEKHYNLPVGKIKKGHSPDFVVVDDLEEFDVLKTIINGKIIDEKVQKPTEHHQIPSFPFRTEIIDSLPLIRTTGTILNLIEIIPGELITKKIKIKVEKDTIMESDPEKDLLKLVLADRYSDDPPVCAFVKGFGLQSGAIAASIAHDSHHIIAAGCTDEDILSVINLVIAKNGGIAFAHNQKSTVLQLPYFGLMTHEPGKETAEKYLKINQLVLNSGCSIDAPFMSLSFLALTVIPQLKINHKGLFDVKEFKNIQQFE